MAIIAPQTAPNFAIGDYHRILKAELLCAPDEPVPQWHIMIGFYASEHARQQNPKTPLWVNHVYIPLSDVVNAGLSDPRDVLYALAMQTTLYAGTNAEGDVETEAGEAAP